MDSSYRTSVDWQAEPALAPWAQPPEPAPLPEPIEPPLDRETAMPRGFAEWFAVSQTLLPALLFLPGSQAYRLPIRVGAYGISLAAFVLWWFDRGGKRAARHPAERWLVFVLLCLVLMIAHPLTNSLLSGIAQTLLYFSILCPLFWAPAYVTTRRQLVRVLGILLVCNGINSMVGVAQVYNPDRFMPPELSSAYSGNPDALASVTFEGPDGRRLIRPPGLFDTPGAVCGAGTIAALLGLIFCFEPIATWKRAIALAFSLAGISAVYLSHVRASLVTALAMMAAYLALLALQNERKRLATFAGFATAIVVVGLSLSTVLGGQSIQERVSSLFEEEPTQVYYQARGQQLEYAFSNLIVNYPLGAGLARWGMMRGYFGNAANLDSSEVWAEVQPNAWILDGGVFLLLLYSLALVMSAFYEMTLIRTLAQREDQLWAAAVAAANVGTLALVFTFVPFGTNIGMQYWFLEGVLHGAMANRPRKR